MSADLKQVINEKLSYYQGRLQKIGDTNCSSYKCTQSRIHLLQELKQ